MKYKLLGAKTIIIGVALVAGIAAGTLGIYYTTVHAGTYHVFSKNQNGQTYGSRLDATNPDTEPDLVSAVGVGGVSGYVKRTDLDEPLPKTPEDAIALNQKNLANPEHQIPLYAVDGKTVIGSFIVGGGTLEENQKAASTK